MVEKVSILGTEYRIETHKFSEDDFLCKNNFSGYCAEEKKLIVIADMTDKDHFCLDEEEQEIYKKSVLRHEVIHAFLNESGLSDNSSVPAAGWAKHEEMIDWFAIQAPKIFKVFEELNVL